MKLVIPHLGGIDMAHIPPGRDSEEHFTVFIFVTPFALFVLGVLLLLSVCARILWRLLS
jgi:hypothetical protein